MPGECSAMRAEHHACCYPNFATEQATCVSDRYLHNALQFCRVRRKGSQGTVISHEEDLLDLLIEDTGNQVSAASLSLKDPLDASRIDTDTEFFLDLTEGILH